MTPDVRRLTKDAEPVRITRRKQCRRIRPGQFRTRAEKHHSRTGGCLAVSSHRPDIANRFGGSKGIYIVCFARRESSTVLQDIASVRIPLTAKSLGNYTANIGAMILFALTGLVHFTCSESPGFLRTMIKIGLATIIGVFLMMIATVVFEMRTMSYTEDPNAPTRLAIFSCVPIVYACWLLTHGNRNQPNQRLQRSP